MRIGANKFAMAMKVGVAVVLVVVVFISISETAPFIREVPNLARFVQILDCRTETYRDARGTVCKVTENECGTITVRGEDYGVKIDMRICKKDAGDVNTAFIHAITSIYSSCVILYATCRFLLRSNWKSV